MTLYHGSTIEVRTPLTHLGRLELDFGQGFYLTKIYKQAVDWAFTKSSRKLGAKAFLNTYILDDAVFEDGGFKGISFDSYDIHWLKFIADSRKGKQPWKGIDYVQGGVANDQVINTVL